MATDHKKGTEENFPFIQEQILSKKKVRTKKGVLSLLKTIVLAVIFGLISSLVFCISSPFFDELLGHGRGKEKAPIALKTSSPAPAQTPVRTSSPVPLPPKTPVRTEGPSVDTAKKTKRPAETSPPAKSPESFDYSAYYSFLSDIASNVNKSIVTVSCVFSGIDLFNNPAETADATYGLIIDSSGSSLLILTSKQKLDQVSSVRVTFKDGTTRDASLYGYDAELGIAVISVPMDRLPDSVVRSIEPAILGESTSLSAGVPILLLGSPTGYVYSMENGIVTGKPYDKYITDYKIELFHTDVCSNPNGEGVVVDMNGHVVGILTHNFSDGLNEPLNTAMGMSRIKMVIDKLINQRDRTYFGIVASDISSDYAKGIPVDHGIYITEVQAKSPAFAAGLQSGDIITEIDEAEVNSVLGFAALLDEYSYKDKIKATIVRTSAEGKPVMSLEVEAGKRDTRKE